MEKIKQLLTNPLVGMDAWYDSYLDDAVKLFEIEIEKGKIKECFLVLDELETSEKIRFFEAITEVQNVSLIPFLFKELEDANIELAEPIIDGLRCWDLDHDDLDRLKCYAHKFLGKSPLLDTIIHHMIDR